MIKPLLKPKQRIFRLIFSILSSSRKQSWCCRRLSCRSRHAATCRCWRPGGSREISDLLLCMIWWSKMARNIEKLSWGSNRVNQDEEVERCFPTRTIGVFADFNAPDTFYGILGKRIMQPIWRTNCDPHSMRTISWRINLISHDDTVLTCLCCWLVVYPSRAVAHCAPVCPQPGHLAEKLSFLDPTGARYDAPLSPYQPFSLGPTLHCPNSRSIV